LTIFIFSGQKARSTVIAHDISAVKILAARIGLAIRAARSNDPNLFEAS
jgi:hypothetical protein